MRALTFDEICSATHGAVKADCDNGFIFHRFTKEQEAAYKTFRASISDKTAATAGVYLEFFTDSPYMVIEFEITPASSRMFYGIDIFIDGKYTESIAGRIREGASSDMGIKTIQLGAGEKCVKILFPWSAALKIISLSLESGASFTANSEKKPKMIMFGDSITHGYDASLPHLAYSYRICDLMGVEGFNKAIGAEIFFPELAECKDAFEPEYITVAYGTNDWKSRSEEGFKRDCDAFFRALSENYPNAKIFAITPIWRKDHEDIHDCGSFENVCEYIFKVAEKYPGVTAIRGFDFVPKEEKYFSDRYLHPNDEGFGFYAKNLFDKLKRYLC